MHIHTYKHTRIVLMAIFQVNLDWPVAMPLDFPSPFVSMLCLLLKQAKIFPVVLDILQRP